MDEAAIKKKLFELSEALSTAPLSGGSAKSTSIEGVYEPHHSGTERTLEESLDCLRLYAKYLLFDLEATRRENRYLRQMLETRRGRKDNEDEQGDSGSK